MLSLTVVERACDPGGPSIAAGDRLLVRKTPGGPHVAAKASDRCDGFDLWSIRKIN